MVTATVRPIKRTLCIGIGGTGRDTLMRLRRFVVEHHGKLSNLPVLSFLSIDTDENALNATGLIGGENYRGERLVFDPSEKLAITMDVPAVQKLVEALEHKGYFDSEFAHIEEWFPLALKDSVKVIAGGAMGIRPVGRLGFFHNFREIKGAIKKAADRTIGNDEFMLQRGFEVEGNGLDIVIVGSLCGGTGSGIFLDVAYTVRHLFPKNVQLFGYLVVDPELYGADNMMQANVYAALKELNYYISDGTTFKARYDPLNQIFVEDKKPPFDYPYLISNRTSDDHKILNKGKLCNVIAYKIYLDIASEVRAKLRADRSAILAEMLKTDLHPFKMPQYYLTFGLSAIYFTRDRLFQIALLRLCSDLLNFWRKPQGQGADAQELLDRFLTKAKWGSERSINVFVNRLTGLAQDSGKTFNQFLESWSRKAQEDIDCQTSEDIDQLRHNLPNQLRRAFRGVQPGESETIRGQWLTLALNAKSKTLESLTKDVDDFLAELLNANDVHFSIFNGLSFLEAMKTYINRCQRRSEEKKREIGGMGTQEKVDRVWSGADEEIEEIMGQNRLPFFRKRNFPRIEKVMKNAVDEVKALLAQNYDSFVTSEAIAIIEGLQNHIALRLRQLNNLDDALGRLVTVYERQEEQQRKLDLNELTGQAIFPEDEIEQFLPSTDSRSKFVNLTESILNKLGLPTSLIRLANEAVFPEEGLKSSLNSAFETFFLSLNTGKMQSVVQRFLTTHPIAHQPIALDQVRRQAENLLDYHGKDGMFNGGVHSRLVAFKAPDQGIDDPFENILTTKLGIDKKDICPIQSEDEILFVREYGGFPLRIIHHLESLKKVYNQQKPFGRLHNHAYIQFDDIVPVEARIISQIEYIFYPCLALNLLTKVSPQSTTALAPQGFSSSTSEISYYEFMCYDSMKQTYYPAQLSSDWKNAIEQLVERQDMLNIIFQLLQQAEEKIIADPSLMQSEYRPLILRFIDEVEQLQEGDRNFVYKTKVIGQHATATTSQTDGIISRYIKQLENKIKASASNSPLISGQPNQNILPQKESE